MKLSDLKVGDKITGMELWGCVPKHTTRTIKIDENGELFVNCRWGKHFFDGQEDEDGNLIGCRLV